MAALFKPGELDQLRTRYPHAVFVHVELARNADLPPLTKQKYVVPKTFTLGQFLFVLRRQLKLPSEKALFVFVDNTLPTSSQTMAELYAAHKSADGCLRITCTSESVFGASML